MKVAKIQHYKVLIEKGHDGFFVARVPALPGCVTQAKTYEQLLSRVEEAIQLCLEMSRNDRQYKKHQKFSADVPTFIGVDEIAVKVKM